MVKKRLFQYSISLLLTCVILVACSSSTADYDAQATQIATEIFATQTAEAENSVPASSPMLTAEVIETIIEFEQATQSAPTATATIPVQETPRLAWTMATSDWAVSGDKIFVEAENSRIQALDLDTGSILWESIAHGRILASDSDNIYISPTTQRIDALDVNTGEPVWTAFLPEDLIDVIRPFTANGIISKTKKHIFWVDKETGSVTLLSTNEWVKSTENTLIIPLNNKAVGISMITGQPLWELQNVQGVCGSIVLFSKSSESEGYGLAAIEMETGNELWDTVLPTSYLEFSCPQEKKTYIREDDVGSEVFSKDYSIEIDASSENIYVLPSKHDRDIPLIALNRNTGEIQWFGNPIRAWIGINTPNEFDFLGEFDGMILYSHSGFGLTSAYDSITHEMLWENPYIVLGKVEGIVGDTLIGVTSTGRPELAFTIYDEGIHTVVGLDPISGTVQWEHTPTEGRLAEIEILDDYILYNVETSSLDSSKNTIWFLNPKSGESDTRIETGLRISKFSDVYFFKLGENILVGSGQDGFAVIKLP